MTQVGLNDKRTGGRTLVELSLYTVLPVGGGHVGIILGLSVREEDIVGTAAIPVLGTRGSLQYSTVHHSIHIIIVIQRWHYSHPRTGHQGQPTQYTYYTHIIHHLIIICM